MFGLSGRWPGMLIGIVMVATLVIMLPQWRVNAIGTGSEKEPNDNIFHATPIEEMTEISGELDKTTDVDYFELVLPSAGRVFIKELSNKSYVGSQTGWAYNIYNAEDSHLTSVYNVSSGGNVYLKKGKYYLAVSSGVWGNYGSYSFYYQFYSSNESFLDTGKDDSVTGANSVVFNKTYKGQLGSDDRKDCYKFTVDKPGDIRIHWNNQAVVKFKAIDSKSNVVFDAGAGEYGGESTYNSHIDSKGTFIIEINQTDYHDGTYQFMMEYFPISLSPTASVVCGQNIKLQLENAGNHSPIWESSDSKMATVDANGQVNGLKAGHVDIFATVSGVTLKCNVQVLYKDVTSTKEYWFVPTNYLTNKNVVKGYDNQTAFQPNNNCTRAQMVTFLWRLSSCPKPKTKKTAFKDVKKNAYYYDAVLWAVEKGITTGYSKTSFKPNNVCTRAQTVTFLWRMAKKPKASTTKNRFTDISKSDYFYNAVLWASGEKIVEGYANSTFRPQNKCTRKQMVTFLYRYDKYVNGKG